MKVYIKNIFLLAAIFTMVCCGEDIDFPLRGKLDEMATADGNSIKVRNDTLCIFPTDDFELSGTTVVDENNVEVLKRYTDSKTDFYWMKAKLGSWCGDIGLDSNKEYIIRREYYYQAIAGNGDYVFCLFVPDGSHMGLVERGDGDFAIGYRGGPNAAIDETDVMGNCKTMIIHIGYDADGNVVDKYFPCSPSDLEWHYSWFDMSSIIQ